MSIEFEQDQFGYRPMMPTLSEERGMAGWLIRKGLVKEKTHANILLIAVILVCIIIGFLSPLIIKKVSLKPALTYKEDISESQLQSLPESERVLILKSLPSHK